MNKQEVVEILTDFTVNRNLLAVQSLPNFDEDKLETFTNEGTRQYYRSLSEDIYDYMDSEGLIVKD